MNAIRLPVLLAAACLVFSAVAHADAPSSGDTLVDPEFLEQYAATYGFRLGYPTKVTPTPDGDAVLFLRSGARSVVRDLYAFDAASGQERQILTADTLLAGAAEVLTAEEKARRERQRSTARGIATFELSRDGRHVLAPLGGSLYLVERSSGTVRELSPSGFPLDPRLSPDARRIAYVVDGDLRVLDVASGRETRLTTRPDEHVTYGLAEFVAQEEMGRHHGFWWSPDSAWLAYQETDVRDVEVFRIADPTDPSVMPQPWPYPRPGKANAKVRLGVLPASGGETVWVDWDRERYPYLATVVWETGGPLTLLVQNRQQTEEVLLAVDPATGRSRQLLVERDAAWLNLDQEMPRWLPDGSGFLWTSERDGAWQVELRAPDGTLRHAVTPPELGYRKFLHLDAEAGMIYVQAGAEPTEAHVFRLPLAPGSAPQPLTTATGDHDAVFADHGGLYVVESSTLETNGTFTVHGRDGRALGTLGTVAEPPPFHPRLEYVSVGEAGFRSVVLRPRDFDPARRYPVVVKVYGGPHSQTVTRERKRYYLDQWIADQGFVVVSIDGRGTPSRGRAWERTIRHNFIDAPLADQAAALTALGERFPEMDLSRVGIYGWSFGGYFAAMAVMRRGDLYHAGVAGAPVVDWHDYDTHYTERYLGLPQENPEGYTASSVLTYAPDLTQPLLVIHGTADDNVYFMHSLKLSQALFRAGRPYDFLPLAGFTHMVPDPLVNRRLYTRIITFLEEHLGEPTRRVESLPESL